MIKIISILLLKILQGYIFICENCKINEILYHHKKEWDNKLEQTNTCHTVKEFL